MQIGAPVAGGGVTITNPFALILGGALGIGGSPPFATLSQTSGAITLASGGSNQNLNITPSGTGLVTCNGDVLNTDNVSFRTWQGQAALVGRGIFTQRAATTSGLYCLAVGSVDTQIEGSVVSGSYGSLTATASGRGLGVNLRTYGGTTWTVAAGMSFLTTQTQSESARGSQILFKTTTNSTTTLNTVLTLDQDQNATFSLGVKTGAPAGGTAAFWKHGVLVTAAVTPDITRYIQLDVGGTLYKLIVST